MTDTEGQRRAAGELEAGVLAALWAADAPQSAAQVRAALSQDLARTTVATLLGRLCEKGLVGRRPGSRGFVYFAAQDSHGLTARRMHRELDQGGGDRSLVLARFVEGLSPDDEAELRRLLKDDHA
ncbi:BlaI/MecI/CopY family transcriptional regulator [Streptomyces sp. NPDC086787]|uniref:BlaI/MecI/CopY family transcriptional regulator n=1 Tax=Streptomyces sp. NPDC086787 TaxID=3365759 RepID=UPI0037FAD966